MKWLGSLGRTSQAYEFDQRLGAGRLYGRCERVLSCVPLDVGDGDARPRRLRLQVCRRVWGIGRRVDRGRRGLERQLPGARVSLDRGRRPAGHRHARRLVRHRRRYFRERPRHRRTGVHRRQPHARLPMDGGHRHAGPRHSRGYESAASGVSADGSVIVGRSSDSRGFYRAFRWTAQTGMVRIDPSEGESSAYSVSGDGSTVVGQNGNAWRWTVSGGCRISARSAESAARRTTCRTTGPSSSVIRQRATARGAPSAGRRRAG